MRKVRNTCEKYLEEYNPAKYWALGKDLHEYLHGVDKVAEDLYDTMYEKLSRGEEYQRTGEYLEDVRRINTIRQMIEEEILNEIVYVD